MEGIESKICPICGKSFVAKTKRPTMFCSEECRAERKRQLGKAYWDAYGKHKKRKRKPKPIEADFYVSNEEFELNAKTRVKSRALDSLSGEELLNYGAVQQRMNADKLRVCVPKTIKDRGIGHVE